ncbi:hypothetical protein E2C01_071270 [Portunus trituberculatus]|uniref:Uncharacterized protein n=1 Tax=Portunus trituberculatus TaxID=210409 RepID=A0A5B7I5R9_PORTR|nr:hypothetical protein [Portunus trituberculatus]
MSDEHPSALREAMHTLHLRKDGVKKDCNFHLTIAARTKILPGCTSSSIFKSSWSPECSKVLCLETCMTAEVAGFNTTR